MSTYEVGQTVQYVDNKGHVKAAIIITTRDSIVVTEDTEPTLAEQLTEVQPAEGHVHVALFGALTDPFHTQPRLNVPTQETAESIPDYRIDGVLVGYVRNVPATVTA